MTDANRITEAVACPSCGCEFASEDDLREHDRSVHGVEDGDYHQYIWSRDDE